MAGEKTIDLGSRNIEPDYGRPGATMGSRNGPPVDVYFNVVVSFTLSES